ncbi:hypothetical protein A0J61_04300 [Choanephora cucurbitarum]|uniref:Uncharacterized protein n=1 Tax=Choanephora cucurbitarum TaxID=101091 RepID=A0A1C7NFB8_9FUNG|nr:hypothetical protein A0J61_04300 [Choanephora cucurbitarum]
MTELLPEDISICYLAIFFRKLGVGINQLYEARLSTNVMSPHLRMLDEHRHSQIERLLQNLHYRREQ